MPERDLKMTETNDNESMDELIERKYTSYCQGYLDEEEAYYSQRKLLYRGIDVRTNAYLVSKKWMDERLKDMKIAHPTAHYEIIVRNPSEHILSPSEKLHRDAMAGLDFNIYTQRFINEMLIHPLFWDEIRRLKQIAQVKPLYLLCFEADSQICHRSIIAQFIVHKYLKFNRWFSKLLSNSFTTIRDEDFGLHELECIYILLKNRLYCKAQITGIRCGTLDEMQDEGLKRDTDSSSREEAITKIRAIYPLTKEFFVFSLTRLGPCFELPINELHIRLIHSGTVIYPELIELNNWQSQLAELTKLKIVKINRESNPYRIELMGVD